MTEFHEQQRRIQALLERHKLDALLLRSVSSFAWATCGAASYVNTAVSNGAFPLTKIKQGKDKAGQAQSLLNAHIVQRVS